MMSKEAKITLKYAGKGNYSTSERGVSSEKVMASRLLIGKTADINH
jgi:hypothetical protein